MKKIIAWLLAFLLTGTLVLFSVSFLGQQAVAPSMNENGAPVSGTVIREEQKLLRERMEKMSEVYPMPVDQVTAVVNEDTLKDLNGQAARWVSSILMTGRPSEGISWDTDELERVLDTAQATATDVSKSVLRMVFPVRQQLIEFGLAKARERIDVPNVVEFALGIPWAALAVCALLAGLIALMHRKIRWSLKYIGAALGATAIVMIALAGLFLSAGIGQMIEAASRSLTVLYRDLLTHTALRAGILTALMIAGCVLCLISSRKDRETA